MSIIVYQIFNAGLDGGTYILNGNTSEEFEYSGSYKGLRVSNTCQLTSLLGSTGTELTGSVLVNSVVTNISGSDLLINDIITPESTTDYFTLVKFSTIYDGQQLISYPTSSI
jgi:hypothetical protein